MITILVSFLIQIQAQSIQSPNTRLNLFQEMAVRLQIMDEKEAHYFLIKWDAKDILTIGLRYLEFQDTPYIWYAELVPHTSICTEFKIQNRSYQRWLENIIAIHSDPYILNTANDTLKETKTLFVIWDYLYDIKNESFHIHVRRRGIKNLRKELDKIDPTWFKEGKFPSHLPIWRMQNVSK